ncbi:MAG: hypothetical protein V4858_06155 [Pseudomonadota bacterium]
MQKTLMKTRWLAVVGGASLLAACGGGGGNSTTQAPGPTLVVGTDVPVAVEQSAKGVIDFAQTQLVATSESSEPLVLGDAKLSTDDAAEPADI